MSRKLRHRIGFGAAALLAIVGLVLSYPVAYEAWTASRVPADAGIPPDFLGNRAAYGFALFSLFSMSSLAIRKLISLIAQLRAEPWREDPDVGLYRMALAALMLTIICGTSPDVVLLLLHGEASRSTMNAIEVGDRIADGITLAPFLAAVALMVRAEQLERVPPSSMRRLLNRLETVEPRTRNLFLVIPRGDGVREHLRIIAGVLVIAAGLALWK